MNENVRDCLEKIKRIKKFEEKLSKEKIVDQMMLFGSRAKDGYTADLDRLWKKYGG
jgi:predicted nucleotidyltransferase